MKAACCIAAIVALLIFPGCISETYDLENLSPEARLSPTFVLPAVKGELTFSDLVKNSNSLNPGDEGLVRIVFRKDSVVKLSRKDIYDLEGILSYSHQFKLGNLKISPFGATVPATPAEITSPMLKKTFPAFTNFTKASFSAGQAVIVVKNEMNHPLDEMLVSFSTVYGPVCKPVNLPLIMPGREHSFTVSLAGVELGNLVTVSVTGATIPGSDEDLNDVTGLVSISLAANNPAISSGNAVIPHQVVTDPETLNYIDLTAGMDIELDQIRFTKGRLLWHAASPSLLSSKLAIRFPTAARNGMPVEESIFTGTAYQSKGSFQLASTIIDLGSDPGQPFNRLPYTCELAVSSGKSMIRFNSNDEVTLELQLVDAVPDYIKGYFGRQVHSISSQSINTGLEEYTGKLNGDIQFTDPVVRLNYLNSFSIPIEVALDIEGTKGQEAIGLGLSPFPVLYPAGPGDRDVAATYVIGKHNSLLPEVISLLPEAISVAGAAKFNSCDEVKVQRDNYIYGSSRFVASVEVEVPLNMRFDSIHLADTVENFLSGDKLFDAVFKQGSNASGKIRIVSLGLRIRNSFPFDVSFNMGFTEGSKGSSVNALSAGKVLRAARTDISGKVVSPSETLATIEFSDEFLQKLNGSDKIIFDFLVSASNPKEIRIFADYKIEFSASVTVDTEINFELPLNNEGYN